VGVPTLAAVLLSGNSAGATTINMNANKITGLADAAVAGDALAFGQAGAQLAGLDCVSQKITSVANPTVATDAATKGYVDQLVQGLAWQDEVLDRGVDIPPGGPVVGDRYIIGLAPVGAWAGHANDITEWDGTDWIFTPEREGLAAYVLDENVAYVYNGVAWVKLTAILNHNDLGGIQGGIPATEYYHLSAAQHTGLTGGGATTLHSHTLDVCYDAGVPGGGRAITADTGAVTITVTNASNNRALELTQNDIVNNPNGMLITNAGTGASIELAGATRTVYGSWGAGGNTKTGLAIWENPAGNYTALTYADGSVNGNTVSAGVYAVGGVGSVVTAVVDAVGGSISNTITIGSIAAVSSASVLIAADGLGTTRTVHIGKAGTPAHVAEIHMCSTIWDVDASGAVTIDAGPTAAGQISLDCAGVGNFTSSGALLTVSGVGLSLYSTGAGTLTMASAAGLDIDATTTTLDCTALSIDSMDTTNLTMTANAAGNKTLLIAAANSGGGAGYLAWSDGYKAGSTYATDLVLSDSSAEWSSFESNFGGEVSLLNAINQCAPILAGWTAASNTDVDIGTEVVDTFTTPGNSEMTGSCFWYWYAVCKDDKTKRNSGTISLNWVEGDATQMSVIYDNPAQVDPTFSATAVDPGMGVSVTVTLSATITTANNWSIKLRRAPVITEAAV
jgi:hypothetical protein